MKGAEKVGERYQDGLSCSTIRIAEVVTGKFFRAATVLFDGPQIPICGVQEGSACDRHGWQVWSGDLGQYPYFLRARIQRGAFLATLAAS